MDDGRIGRDRFFPFPFARSEAPAPAWKSRLETMLGRQPVEEFTNRRGERVAGCNVRPPQGVSAARRQDSGRENGAKRRRLDEGDIGVPVVVIRQIAGACLNQSDLWNVIDVRVDRMDVQFAEARGEPSMLFRIQRLAFKEK